MNTYLRNPLTIVWAFLTVITVVSWLISRDVGVQSQISAVATAGILLIAAVKVHFVLSYFMEVRGAPVWLKRVTVSWLVLLLILLFIFYGIGMNR
jgi:hypothetical protein